jgi:exonuclease SbcD
VVSHAFVVGGESSESERQLEVGGTGAVDRAVFDGFSYVALGHLHRPQAIGRETIRYSGTPLPYSFSEDHAKSVVVVDLDAAGNGTIEEIPVPIGRRVVTIRGELDELLRSDLRPDARACFVRAIVTNRETVLDAKARLEQIYPYVVEVRLEPAGRSSDSFAHDAAPIERLEPIEVTRRFWEELEGGAPDADTDELLLRSVAAAMEVTS